MAVKAVFFDVGETLVDETRTWERAADAAGVSRFTLMGVLGGLAARGEPHGRVWEILGVDRPDGHGLLVDFYDDALPCLEALRGRGHLVGAIGNTARAAEAELRPYVDVVGSSSGWGVEKPAVEFFERVVREADLPAAEVAYVGDRVDNDVLPALEAGMVAVHVRRGPWGLLHPTPPGAVAIDSLAELPGALARV
jgi:HAD superfamily hydrolase (TIGR01509 family)